MGPMVVPQGVSLRTMNSCTGTTLQQLHMLPHGPPHGPSALKGSDLGQGSSTDPCQGSKCSRDRTHSGQAPILLTSPLPEAALELEPQSNRQHTDPSGVRHGNRGGAGTGPL